MKNYLLDQKEIKNIITLPMGYGLISDRVTVDGLPIGYMYRENPDNRQDSGWRFFAGDESEEYLDQENNISLMNINTIAHYDQSIIPYLEEEIGKAFGKNDSGEFVEEHFEPDMEDEAMD
ncbi:DUF2185 domain-containing protein [Faecalibacter sp. LW9]|uniref:DUF2185 domain-containing protein n=1 Tax=Faecalibacter sp. LW9 TaxID=3103144 RepID=UPI002AFF13FF|nr:DUF2185 domain-containing protein [Faecalibacter sp. LW9]